jgi:hypothetical protein
MGWPRGWTSCDPLNSVAQWRIDATNNALWDKDPAENLNGIPRTTIKCENRQSRIKALGNGQVPTVVTLAWKTLFNQKRGPKHVDNGHCVKVATPVNQGNDQTI